jgi:anti-sigma B factor antagonist
MAIEKLEIVVHTDPGEGQRILSLKGPLSLHTVFGFQDAVRAETSSKLILDFSGVPFIDSSGLGALVSVFVASKKTAQKLAFASLNPQVKALMEMTKVSQLFPIYPSVQDAQAALSGVPK